ncbi:unnamed protein product [Lactuca saligna]|uniref:PB1-like domain-containing protein n=1 Tax=Lactuca saligna TaxID=75948 RepID=A0AA36EQ51_LACSI|nr:unnamed protein product [Lactuca saligna]
MVYVMWQIKPKNEAFDVSSTYVGGLTWFSIKLHHYGKFTKLLDIKYIRDEVGYADYVDINEFYVHELDVIMLELGYPDLRMNEVNVSNSPVIYYHFKIPNGEFQFSLRALRNDQDVINLSKYIPHNKLIEIYTEHGKTNLLTYFMSPNAKGKVVIEELPEYDVQETKVHVESSLGNMNHVNDEHIDDIDELEKKTCDQDAATGKGSTSKIIDNIDDATTSVLNNNGVEGSTSKNVDNIHDARTGVMDNEGVKGCYKPSRDDMNGVQNEDDDAEYEDMILNSKDDEAPEKLKHSEDDDEEDYTMDQGKNTQDVDVDVEDIILNVDSDMEGGVCINDVHVGNEPKDMGVINNEE